MTWWIWPPRPEHRIVITVKTDKSPSCVSADGRTLWVREFVEKPPAKDGDNRFANVVTTDPNTGKLRPYNGGVESHNLQFFDTASGDLQATIGDVDSMHESPDGTRMAFDDAQGRWHICSMPSGKTLHVLPKEIRGSGRWTPYSRHLLISFKKTVSVVQAEAGTVIGSIPLFDLGYTLFPDGSGLATKSTEREGIDLWSFRPFRMMNTLLLPSPLARYDYWSEAPKPHTMSVDDVIVNRDGSVIAASVVQYVPEDAGFKMVASIQYWNRKTGTRTEVVRGQGLRRQIATSLSMSMDGRFMKESSWMVMGSYHWPEWQREGDQQVIPENCWDFSTTPPRSIGTGGTSDDDVYHFEPAGNRAIVYAPDLLILLDAKTLKEVGRIPNKQMYRHIGVDSRCPIDPTGRWICAEAQLDPPTWIPNWLMPYARRVFPSGESTSVYRLHDGLISRSLPRRNVARFTTDGKLWTQFFPDSESHYDKRTVILERWSPETPTPWWLILVTVIAISLTGGWLGCPHWDNHVRDSKP